MARKESLSPGESIAGILIDGVDGTPFVVGNLLFEESRGIRVEVPYVEHGGTGQFTSAQKWFSKETPPRNLYFVSNSGALTLFGCRHSGYSSNFGLGVALGKIAPAEVVFRRREGSLSEPLAVKTVRSYFDGLKEWTNLSSVKEKRVVDGSGLLKKMLVEVESTQSISWWQGSAKMNLSINWSTKAPGDGYLVDEAVYLESTFREPRSISAHLKEHDKVRSLVALVHGTMVYYRKHLVRDKRFPLRLMNGKIRHFPLSELISRTTVREFGRDRPPAKALSEPLASADEVGGTGLGNWARMFEDWERYVYPALSSMNVKEVGIENSVVNASMAMEAAGSIIGIASGENVTHSRPGRPTTATFVLRCLERINFPYSGIAESRIGLARAIANNYNTIKHYDRGEFPKPEETLLVQKVASLIVRLIALDLAGVDPESQHLQFRKEREFSDLCALFKANGVFIDGTGVFRG